ncbi:MAG: FHA domain-containing protein [Candidatus Krumholzibacteriota bacterium]|nr:FHA domain-containing protein [Candidatus Krumholzibacteriota bacterium]
MKGDNVTTKNSTRGHIHKTKNSNQKKNGQKSKAVLEITNGCFSGLKIEISKKSTLLGSSVDCDICLDHSFVSPEHAQIINENGSYFLEDLNSRHGTNLNGKEIHKIKINNNDLIGIGNYELRFRFQ